MINEEICYCVTSLDKLLELSGNKKGKIPLLNNHGKKVSELAIHLCAAEYVPKFSHYLKDGY